MTQKLLKKKLNNLFFKLKIKKNDNVIIHTNLGFLYQYTNQKINLINVNKILFDFLKEYFQKKNTVLIPVYNYQFTKKGRINFNNSKSELGSFNNFVINKKGTNRTIDPVFSHIILGRHREILKLKTNEAFGIHSIFNYLYKNKYKIVCLGCSVDRITFLHYIEKVNYVPYRYNKIFSGHIVFNNVKKKINYKYFVGDKKIDYSIKEKNVLKLVDKQKFKKVSFGKFNCYSTSAHFLMREITKKLKKNKYFLIK